MTYQIVHKPTFDRSFVELPKDLQKRTNKAIDVLRVSPGNTNSKNLEKLRSWERLWTYRVNDSFRLLYAIHPPSVVQLLDIGKHDYIYGHAIYSTGNGDAIDTSVIEDVMDPQTPTTAAQVANWSVARKPIDAPEQHKGELIPMELTAEVLAKLHIPPVYHDSLIACQTADDLLECGLADDVFDKVYGWLYDRPGLVEIAQEPNYVLKDSADLQRYADGDLMSFLLWLDDEQRQLVDFSLKGPTLVKGGPGSGKSTVALYRIKALVEQDYLKGLEPSVLFTTYTKTLVAASEQLLSQLLKDPGLVKVSTVDSIAWRIVVEAEKLGRGGLRMAGDSDWEAALSSARTYFDMRNPESLEARTLVRNNNLPDSYLADEMQWVIEGQGITTLEQYLTVKRHGRHFALNRWLRTAVWQIYQHVSSYFESNSLTTWNGLRCRALEHLEAGRWHEVFDYVVVDEAQDLTPMGLALCVKLCRSPEGVFLAADASQSIYNKGFSWQSVHEDLKVTGRTRILKRNYRTTRQIAEAAHYFLSHSGVGDEDVLSQFYVRSGSRPQVFAAKDDRGQTDWMYNQMHLAMRELRLDWGSIAVLVPSNSLGVQAKLQLEGRGVPVEFVRKGKGLDLSARTVKVLTIYSAKGLEFPVVILPYLDEGVLPHDLDETEEDYLEKMDEQRRLFFVGATRAMLRLLVTFSQDVPSPFIGELLSSDLWELVKA